MMSSEQAKTVSMVYRRFIQSEAEDWTGIDEILALLENLSDKDVVKESEVMRKKHLCGVFRCEDDHDQQHCMAPHILEAVGAILDLYHETKNLHSKNKYILKYYLTMSELGIVYSA